VFQNFCPKCFQLESPFLNNGHASGKLKVNCASHNYRAMFSVNNDLFLSGSFELLPAGFETAFGLQSTALRSEFQVNGLLKYGTNVMYYDFEQVFAQKIGNSVGVFTSKLMHKK
jgi:hypothetical protein